MTTAEAVILGIVEGLTEFVPVSSTGHMILAEALLGMEKSSLTNVFIVNIQFGAILAVLILYWRRFLQSMDLYYKLIVAFLPAAFLGLLLHKQIDRLLASTTVVAVSLIVGGVALVLVDRIFKKQIDDAENDEDTEVVKRINEFGVEVSEEKLVDFPITFKQAFIIGLYQTIGMIPGMSRSAVTIIGGLTQKFNIKRAAEFSFFLGVPTIAAAAGFKLVEGILQGYGYIHYSGNEPLYIIKSSDVSIFVLGNVVSFIVGIIAIKFLIDLLTPVWVKIFWLLSHYCGRHYTYIACHRP